MIPALTFIPPVIAHRGVGALAPENTLASIRMAKEQGAHWVEFDVKITYDGVPILMHDEKLERTTDGCGLVSEVSWEEMQRFDAGRRFDSKFEGERIPLLADALKVVLENDLSALIEIKPCPGRAKATTMVAMIEIAKIWPEQDVFPVISSFDMDSLEVAAQLEPPWPRCVLMREWEEDWRRKLAQVDACAISFKQEHLTEERVKEISNTGVSLLAYSVDNADKAKELLAWGVSAVYSCAPRTILGGL
jgi:glycerophosphoryl diester phosphodiesterase